MMLPSPLLLLLFAVRFDPADPDLLARLGAFASTRAHAAAAAAAAVPQPQPQPREQEREQEQEQERQPGAAPRVRPRWGEEARRLPPPISSLRGRPALVRTRTGDGRLVITRDGEGSAVARGRLLWARRREGEGRLTMHLLPRDIHPASPPRPSSA